MSIDLKFTAHVDRPVETAFAIATDLPKMKYWAGKDIRSISPGPLGVGTTFDLINEFLGADQRISYKVTEYDLCKAFGYVGSGLGSNEVHLTFEPDGENSVIVSRVSVRLSGMVASLAKGVVKSMAEKSVVALVELIEGSE